MVIRKNRNIAGWYTAEFKTANNNWLFGSGKSHTEALTDLFESIKWNNIGNWSVQPPEGETKASFGAVADLIALNN